jgi:hypothetical protein
MASDPATQKTETPEPDAAADQNADGELDLSILNERLAGLVATVDDRDDAFEQITASNTAIADRLSRLESLLSQQPARAPATEDPLVQFFGSAPKQQSQQQRPQGDIRGLLADIVRQEIAPLVTDFTASKRERELHAAHQASYSQAAAELPALNDPKSVETQLFQKIYAGDPELRQLKNAPRIIAATVRGLVSDARAKVATQAGVKREAAVTRPATRTVNTLPGDLQKANELKGQLEERGREGTLNDRDFNDLVRLSLATQITEAQNGSK